MIKALDKYRKTGGPLKCKSCVSSIEAAERQSALERAKLKEQQSTSTSTTTSISTSPPIACASCKKTLPSSSFNKNQYNKGNNKGRCRPCVEQALKDEAQTAANAKQAKIDAAKAKVLAAKTPMEKLKAESELSALEAEHVTGLKPMKMGRGRGRGRGRGGAGRGRGRGFTGRR